MYKIIKKEVLHETITRMTVEAPDVARHAKPGMFIILRVEKYGERIPLTIADYDREKGTVSIIFQVVGATTMLLNSLNEGEFILDFVGPLGNPTNLDGIKKAAVVGGGLGVAIAFPQAKALHNAGVKVTGIMGFRSKELFILHDELNEICDKLILMTDDGSNGNKGFVTDALKKEIEEGNEFDTVIAVGPLPMMKAVCDITKPFGIKTIVSLNPIMIDGTGMCGGCRVTVGGETKFACIDGPDFDGHQVDFNSAMIRSRMFKKQERDASCLMIKKSESLAEKSDDK